MTAYSVFNEDTGQITISNKVYDDGDGAYGRVLAEREMKFIGHETPNHAQLERHYVWQGELSERPHMFARIDRLKIGIGESAGAVITNVPNDATLTIAASGIQFFHEQVSGTRIDLCAPVPGIYTVRIQKWPYRDFTAEIVAQ